MSTTPSDTHWSRWIIGTLISLLAAGGGIVALLTYLHLEPIQPAIPKAIPLSEPKSPDSPTVIVHTKNGYSIETPDDTFHLREPLRHFVEVYGTPEQTDNPNKDSSDRIYSYPKKGIQFTVDSKDRILDIQLAMRPMRGMTQLTQKQIRGLPQKVRQKTLYSAMSCLTTESGRKFWIGSRNNKLQKRFWGKNIVL